MSTAIAMAPSPAPHDRPSFSSELPPPASTAPSASAQSPSAQRSAAPPSNTSTPNAGTAHRSGSRSPRGPNPSKSSPPSASRNASGGMPKIIVKKEPPASPDLPTSRHRPRKLDLSKGGPVGPRPLTARDGLGIQEVGLACLSPGFVTQDPVMKEQLQRSMSVREQQRHIIEARLQQQSAKGDGPGDKDGGPQFSAKTPGMSRRNKAPPGLSIVAPGHEHFATERVIQSAPLGQTFTGLHNHAHPLTRHITNQPSKLSGATSHIHHVPAKQTNNRLPPIADVFPSVMPQHSHQPDSARHNLYPEQGSARPLASPGHPPPPPPPPPPHHQHQQQQHHSQQQQQQHQSSTPGGRRSREYQSAEEAQHELAGGRPELLPKLVHYGGHQPPTPPSPQPPAQHGGMAAASAPAAVPGGHRPTEASRSASHGNHHYAPASSSKRRTRAEYEEGGSPPLGNGPAATRRSGPFGAGRDSPETQRAKRDEFLRLCERAWDLFHS